MLEQLLIFTRAGLILWTCKELGNALRGSSIDALIRSCLLEERSGASSYNYDAPGASYTLKWAFHNELGLVFVAVYQKILHLLYVDDLLARQLKAEAEARAEEMKKPNQSSKPLKAGNAKKQSQVQKGLVDGG
ncbi:G-protein [Lithospermum erythrorhizon]|uniref:G-protein n=1 Tax=Lithospermum erythrorhizon TaxID=34254 RepID=A0AAV3RGZ8_LITER